MKQNPILTPRECEIRDLVTQLRTAAEIAIELSRDGQRISTRTVETHIRNIARKLGDRRRTPIRAILAHYGVAESVTG